MVNISMREEILIMTMVFIFCAVSVPIIILTSEENKHDLTNKRIEVKDIRYMSGKDKMLSAAVGIIEDYNGSQRDRISMNDIFRYANSDINLLNVSTKDANALKKLSRRNVREIWKNFRYENDSTLTSKNTLIPLRVDWRERGVISFVKSQQKCGSCWAQASLGVIEAMNALRTGYLTELSVQQMLDCNADEMNCSGGDVYNLLSWLYEDQISIHEKDEYSGCESNADEGVKIRDFSMNNFTNSEHLMLLYLAHYGPLITCVNSINWMSYMEGIIQQNCNNDFSLLNHVVEIVGYDMTDNVPYYIIKNSWGPHYGAGGYLKLAIGRNVCGIAERVFTVFV